MASKFVLLVSIFHHFPLYSFASAPGKLALFVDEECQQASVINPTVSLPIDTCLVPHGALGIAVEVAPPCASGDASVILYGDASCANPLTSNFQYDNCYYEGLYGVSAFLFACTAVAGGAVATATSTVSAGLSSIPVAVNTDTATMTASASTPPPSSPTSPSSSQTTTKSSQEITNSFPSSTNSPQSSSNSGSGDGNSSNKPVLSQNIIIGIAVGGFAALVLACLLGICIYRQCCVNKGGSRSSRPTALDDSSSAWVGSRWGGSQYGGPRKPAVESWVMEDQSTTAAYSDYGDESRGQGRY